MSLVSPDDYFRLRRLSEGLQVEGRRFEGIPWSLCRETDDGWKMTVYRVEGEIEVCVMSPDGQTKTFA